MEKRTCWTSEVCEMMCSDQDDEEQEEGQKQKKSNNDDVQINSRKQNKARKPNVARKGQRNNFVKQQSKRKKTFGQRKFPRRGGRKNYLQTQAGQTGQFDESSYKIGSCFRCGNPGHWANECTEDPNTQGQQKRPKNSEIIDILEPKLDLKPLTQDFSEHGINAIFQQVFGHEKVSTEQYSVLNKLLKMESVLMCMSRNSGKRTVVLLACLLLDGIGIVVNEQWPDFGCEGIKVQRAHQPTSQCQGRKALWKIGGGQFLTQKSSPIQRKFGEKLQFKVLNWLKRELHISSWKCMVQQVRFQAKEMLCANQKWSGKEVFSGAILEYLVIKLQFLRMVRSNSLEDMRKFLNQWGIREQEISCQIYTVGKPFQFLFSNGNALNRKNKRRSMSDKKLVL
eukprot:TRINITY_DN5004_c0_g1_i2.p1 TRINITY_DN5004_c0_g1~~TRINITY_DN5004_c0_g1_i2.p1  ORF type:complete len:395 (-),score=58.37 TRINITY_DN5004_c0_g1_i2:218-1402(-)